MFSSSNILTESHWVALARYTTNGRLEMTNNAAERSIRPFVGWS